jgi:hypothetical protein
MRGEQQHPYAGVVNVCSNVTWLSAPWVSASHWSLMGGFEPLLDKQKESVLLVGVL